MTDHTTENAVTFAPPSSEPLFTCETCWAAVSRDHMEAHAAWHGRDFPPGKEVDQ